MKPPHLWGYISLRRSWQVPYFNAPIFLENITQVGKVRAPPRHAG